MTKQEFLSFLGKPVVSTVRRDAMAKGCTGIVVAVRTDDFSFSSGDYVFCVDVTKTTTAYLHEFDMLDFGGADAMWKTIKNPPHSFQITAIICFVRETSPS